jgi:hypothetical protein
LDFFTVKAASRANGFYCYGLQIFAAVITWIIVFWNIVTRIVFRTSLKTEVAVSPKFWMIVTRAKKIKFEDTVNFRVTI